MEACVFDANVVFLYGLWCRQFNVIVCLFPQYGLGVKSEMDLMSNWLQQMMACAPVLFTVPVRAADSADSCRAGCGIAASAS